MDRDVETSDARECESESSRTPTANPSVTWKAWVVRFLTVTTVAAVCVVALSYLRFGSPWPAVVYLQGRSFYVEKPPSDLGVVRDDDEAKATFVVYNMSSTDYNVVGTNSDCSCVRIEDLPVRIPRWSKGEVRFRIKPGGEGREKRTIGIYTDCPSFVSAYANVEYACIAR
ncbi:DUF1573 domain-containing protein [Planctomyces sp. SH-PL62]|uniref:DUF1573 domain-containing protein n=1 Tax=Planctomyces sp. SH-PL62 TaxID=1636152 RepID=UPI00078C4152|nr:DUF1573 domain-containing protein [Planctomyces sp. SH-PL62]AMV40952.1 hypothetical protein VT85_26190 [Planctomyces sp. SH-PL62]